MAVDQAWMDAIRRQAIVPVLSFDDPVQAVAMAHRLVKTGKPIMEFTLRKPQALDVIATVIEQVPSAIVGVGSIRCPDDMEDSVAIGARFLISPGFTPALLSAGAKMAVPYIPGVATASDILQTREAGYRLVKFFPAQFLGGACALAALAATVPDMLFMPTGGIREGDLTDYLALACVVCCGSSSTQSEEKVYA